MRSASRPCFLALPLLILAILAPAAHAAPIVLHPDPIFVPATGPSPAPGFRVGLQPGLDTSQATLELVLWYEHSADAYEIVSGLTLGPFVSASCNFGCSAAVAFGAALIQPTTPGFFNAWEAVVTVGNPLFQAPAGTIAAFTVSNQEPGGDTSAIATLTVVPEPALSALLLALLGPTISLSRVSRRQP